MRNNLAVKICGINSQSAIDTALSNGVDYLGFVFFPPSPRYLTPRMVATLLNNRPADVNIVAVVVDPSDELLE